MELDKKETMLQEYMRKMPTGGQTTLEMDLLKEQQEAREATETSGFRALFKSRKDMIEPEVHSKLKHVLEETLLENIRLKGDLDTMGLEVEKLRTAT